MVQANGVCEACGKPFAKTGTMTQWVFRPAETCACSAQDAATRDLRSCPVCGQVARSRTGTMTQWIFQFKPCDCLSTELERHRELDRNSELFLDADSIEGNPYEWFGECGSGAFATVYKAKDRKLGRFVAIKVPHDLDERATANFLREAKSASQLYHPNIVSILDVGTLKGGRQYLISEWIEGITLAQYFERHGTLSIESATEIFSQVLDALSHAHRNGIIHRDIKPSNIMLGLSSSGGWSVKVIDFGSAKRIDQDGYTTKVYELACSPFYMSPEQVTDSVLDQRTDLYSLGCTLFEALTGRVPFKGQALSVVMRHQTETPPTLSVAAGGKEFPAYLEQIVARLLEKNPDSRFQSADEVKEALLLKEALPVESSRPSSVSRGRAPWIVPGAIALGVLFAGTVAALTLNPGERAKPAKPPITREEKKRKEVISSLTAPSRIFGGRVAYTINGRYSEAELVNEDLSFLENKPITMLGVSLSSVGDAQMPLIGKMQTLRTLLMDMCEVTDEGLKDLAPLRLTNLNLANNKIKGPGLKYINFERLRFLDLNKCRLDDSVLDWLPRSTQLYSLAIADNRITDKGVRKIVQLFPSLEVLSLRSTLITDKALTSVSTLKKLRFFSIEHTGITDEGIEKLYGLPLEELNHNGTKITSKGVAEIRKHFPGIVTDKPERENESAEILLLQP